MSILDGPSTVLLYPEVDSTDADGNPVRVPDRDCPVTVRGSMQHIAAVEDDRGGQVQTDRYRLLCRRFPAGAWPLASWDGREWDVEGGPRRRSDSPGTAHDTVILSARSPRPAGT